ncbi:hypothetical protein, partial [uncultured Maritalea sp.]|uniref:hypothetical protein n=1 Tax=uncultured Maritalea sp. TaxID=757249 RepID=UPI002616FCAE
RNQAQLQAMVAWQAQVASSFDSLRSDLANMGQDLATKASSSAVEHLIDRTLLLEAGVSRNWEAHKRLEEEVGASSVLLLANTEHFINDTKSDTDHADYAARVGGGLSFPLSASSTPVGGIELQDPADPKVTVQNGMMTPVSSSKNRTLENGSVNGAVQIQSYTNVEHTSRAMTGYSDASHYGPGNYHYENFVGVPGVAWNAQSARPSGKKMIGGVKYSLARYDETSPGSGTFKLTYITIVEAQREYTYYVQEEVETTITAQGRGQTVYAANGGWLDQIGFHVTGNGPGNIEVLVCECDGSGTPDLNKALARTSLAAGDIVQGINQVPIEPVYIAPGTRYAPVFLSTGAYNLGTTSTGRAVTNGQHFALVGSNRFEVPGTEGEKDLFLQLRYKTHEATTVAVTLQPLQLADGIDSLKIAFKRVIPLGTNVYFEVMVGSTWYRCGPGQSIPEVDWSLQPNLMPFRVVFVGTKDGMPSIGIGANSEITVGRVATSLTHIAEPIDAGAVASEVRVRVRMDGFDEAKHDCVVSLIVAGVEKTATAVEDATIDGNSIYRTATFSLAGDANQQFAPKIVASMSNVAEPFSITERFDYAAV